MSNIIKIKRGSGIPKPENLTDGELGYSRDKKTLYIKDNDDIVPLTGGGGGGSGSSIELDDTLSKYGYAADAEAVGKALKQLKDDLTYKEIAISSFTITPSWKEVGDTPTKITLKWSLSKEPTDLSIDGMTPELQQNGSIVRIAKDTDNTETFSENRTWSIIAVDEKNAQAKRTVSITYKKPWYSGSALKPDGDQEIYDSDFIKQFSDKNLVPDRTVEFGQRISQFNFNATDGKYVYYCCPEGGTYTFKKGGLPFIMNKVGRVDNYENQYNGKLGPYVIYRTLYPDFQQSTAPVEVVVG